MSSRKVRYAVGIDQSYSSTGLVVLDLEEGVVIEHCTIKAGNSEMKLGLRLHILISKLLSSMPSDVGSTYVCLEGGAFASEFNTFRLGELSGAIRYALYKEGYEVEIVQPTTLKKFITGKGSATKVMMAQAVKERWGFENTSDDIIDAYGLARAAEYLGNNRVEEAPHPSKNAKPSKPKTVTGKRLKLNHDNNATKVIHDTEEIF